MRENNRFHKPDYFGYKIDNEAHKKWVHPLPTLEEMFKIRNIPSADYDKLEYALEKSFSMFRTMKDNVFMEYIKLHGQLEYLKTSKSISPQEYEERYTKLAEQYHKKENYEMNINSRNIKKFVSIGIALDRSPKELAELTGRSLKQIKRIIKVSSFDPAWLILPPDSISSKLGLKAIFSLAWREAKQSLSLKQARIWNQFHKDVIENKPMLFQKFNNDTSKYYYWVSGISAKKMGIRPNNFRRDINSLHVRIGKVLLKHNFTFTPWEYSSKFKTRKRHSERQVKPLIPKKFSRKCV